MRLYRHLRRGPAGLLTAALLTTAILTAALLTAGNATYAAAQTDGTGLSERDRATVERIQAYIEGIDTLRAKFRQRSSNGTRARGTVWIDRPGKVRFEYAPPSDIVMIANGSWLLYFNRRLEQTSYVPVDETPLWPLLKADVDILGEQDFAVARVTHAQGRIRVTVVRGGARPGEPGSLELYFTDEPLALTRWRLVDQQGTVTVVDLTDVQRGVSIPDRKFDFNALDLPQRGRQK